MLVELLCRIIGLLMLCPVALLVFPLVFDFLSSMAGMIADEFRPRPQPAPARPTTAVVAVKPPEPYIPVLKKRPPRFAGIRIELGKVRPERGRFHADENRSSAKLYQAMRRRGLRVTRTVGDLRGMSDPQQLAHALSQRAMLVTSDKGLFRSSRNYRHAGVIWVPSGFDDEVLAEYCARLGGSEAGHVPSA